jgi:signal transduction histidine kinase
MFPLANAQIPPSPRRIELRYSAPYFGTPERVRVRYRLAGVDETWVNAGTERAATFARLPAGRYQFEVGSTDAEGHWQPAIASVAFTVRAAWWEMLWFRIGLAIVAAVLIAATVRIVVKRRMRRRLLAIQQEHALERERIRIARDMHDQLGANLTQIGIASQLARLDPAGGRGHVDEIATIARDTVESLDEIVWAVNPRYDTLASLLEYLGKFAVSFLSSSGIAVKVEIPHHLPARSLPSNVRHHLFLAVKEALNNVVKHAGATTVYLKVELTDDLLRVIVTDDGRGFQAATVQADANGLRNIRERMSEMGGACRIDGTPGAGTRVICELPVSTNGA